MEPLRAFVEGFFDGFGPIGLFFALRPPYMPDKVFADEMPLKVDTGDSAGGDISAE